MKILFVNKFHYRKGGAETVYFDTANIFIENGHEVHYFSLQNSENEKCNDEKYFIKNRDYSKGSGFFGNLDNFLNMLYSFEAKRNLKKMIKDVGPFDVAYLHNIYHQISPSIIDVLKKNKIKIVMVVHDLNLMCPNYKMVNGCGDLCEKCKNGKYYNCTKYKCVKNSFSASLACSIEAYFHKLIGIYNKVDTFITPSLFMKNKMIEYGFAESKIMHVNNPIKIQDEYTKNQVGDYYLFIGRLSKEKGVNVLVNAFSKLKDKKVVIVGDGPELFNLENFVKENKLENIKFLGYKKGEELKDLIKKSKAVIVPSVVYENQPMSIIEAFSFGKVVIGSNIGGIPELIGNNERGFLFKMGSSNDLINKINAFEESDEFVIEEMGKKAYEFVRDNFNEWERIGK